jgi:hypothetical protein
MTDAGINALALVLGQAGGLVVYVRNLALIYRKRGLTDGEVLGAGDALYVHPADEQTGQGSAPSPAPTESPDDAPVSE